MGDTLDDVKLSGLQQCGLALTALLLAGLMGCGGSSKTLIPPVPTGSPSAATYPTTAALAYAIACNDLKSAGKALFPGTPKQVARCVLNNSRVLLAIYATESDRQAASTLEAKQLSGTGPTDQGIADGANWIVAGPNSVLSTVTFRIHGQQERPTS